MARLRLEIDPETYERLVAQAVAARRPVGWHAEVLLRRALGLPFLSADPEVDIADGAAESAGAEVGDEDA